jgi:hypothetical protein
MRLFDNARRPPQRLRAVLASLLLVFALNSIAHAAHRHEPSQTTSSHAVVCGYCVTFSSAAALPSYSAELALTPALFVTLFLPSFPPLARRSQRTDQPRAPPLF